MLAFAEEPGQGGGMAERRSFSVVAVTFFGKKELNDWSERSPRGYIQYLVQPIEKPRGER
jgi:hypothetical protein